MEFSKIRQPRYKPIGDKNIVVFSSHTHIAPFAGYEAIIGDVGRGIGLHPWFLKPQLCTCRMSQPIEAEDKQDSGPCKKCASVDSLLSISLRGWSLKNLSEYAEEDDQQAVKNSMDSLSAKKPQDFFWNNLPLGKIALFDILLELKWSQLHFTEDQAAWRKFGFLVASCIHTGLRLQRFLCRACGSRFVVFNYPYSLNRLACGIAERLGLKIISITGGHSLRYTWKNMIIANGSTDESWKAAQCSWNRSRSHRVLSAHEIQRVGEHFDELFSGKEAFAYSSPPGSVSCRGLLERIRSSNRRILLLAATSSSDERFTGEMSGIRAPFNPHENLFYDHAEWLTFLIESVRNRQDIGLIIRIHPREFPNKRESVLSSNALNYRKMLSSLPSNVIVNWPSDGISLYDLIWQVNIVTTCWSSAALEASIFGSPIVLPENPVAVYRPLADFVCKTRESYWNHVLECAVAEPSFERSVRTFRWYWLTHFGISISLESHGFCPIQKAKELKLKIITRLMKLSGVGREFNALLTHTRSFRGRATLASVLQGKIDPLKCSEYLEDMQRKNNSEIKRNSINEILTIKIVLKQLASRLNDINPSKPNRIGGKLTNILTSHASELKKL